MSERIKQNMKIADIIYELSEGNPGALKVIMNLLDHNLQDEPFGFMHLLQLDQCEIYGSNIWVLYKDICNENLDLVCLVLRAHQFGTFTKEEIAEVLKEHDTGHGHRKLISKDIPIDETAYNIKGNAIYDSHKFEEYLKKQREFFESQQSTFGG